MAPIRRYLRISKHSVLECRIFLENPADGPRWLLRAQDPALPRVFEAVKSYVLPKLREENERMKGKGKKKKSVKDVVKQDDFEVSIFLTEVRTRHALLVKNKTFAEEKARSTNGQQGADRAQPVLIQEESDDEDLRMNDIPAADANEDVENDGDRDDKKKMHFNTTYDGFNIWGFVLCLLVERKGGLSKKPQGSDGGNAQVLMEQWISTQQAQDDES